MLRGLAEYLVLRNEFWGWVFAVQVAGVLVGSGQVGVGLGDGTTATGVEAVGLGVATS